jgi:hypothetical protein
VDSVDFKTYSVAFTCKQGFLFSSCAFNIKKINDPSLKIQTRAPLACVVHMLCFALLCFVLLCFALLCFALLCFALLCFALLCFALLCFAVLCFALILYCSTSSL